MNSQDISESWQLGDSDWKSWERGKTARGAPRKPGVYVFRIAKPATLRRAVGGSDIAYIGNTSTRTLQERLLEHSKERTDADSGRRIRRLEQKHKLEVAWKVSGLPEDEETKLLAFYEVHHFELPPCNLRRENVP